MPQPSFEEIVDGQFPLEDFPTMWMAKSLDRDFQHIVPNTDFGELVLNTDIEVEKALEEHYETAADLDVSDKTLDSVQKRMEIAMALRSTLDFIYHGVVELLEDPEDAFESGRYDPEKVDEYVEDVVDFQCMVAKDSNVKTNLERDDSVLFESIDSFVMQVSVLLHSESEIHFQRLKEGIVSGPGPVDV